MPKRTASPEAFQLAQDFLGTVGVTLEQKGDWYITTNYQGKTKKTTNIYNAVVDGLGLPRKED